MCEYEDERVDFGEIRLSKLLMSNPASSVYSKLKSELKNKNSSRRFKIALTFPGEFRESIVSKIAEKLSSIYGTDSILYDRFHEAEFSVLDLDIKLQELYSKESDIVVLFGCKEYNFKKWCKLEWRSVRAFISDILSDNKERLFIFSIDNTLPEGLFPEIDGYTKISSSQEDIDKATRYINERYNKYCNGV
jgi:hypothetical protein